MKFPTICVGIYDVLSLCFFICVTDSARQRSALYSNVDKTSGSVSVTACIFTSSVGMSSVSFSNSCSTSGSGQFSTAAKCSCHLFICYSCVAACLPSLSLIGGRFTYSPASSLTAFMLNILLIKYHVDRAISYTILVNVGLHAYKIGWYSEYKITRNITK